MKHFRLLAIVICLFSIFALASTAGAWGWYGFSKLCVEGSYRGPEGVVVFTLSDVTVYTQCDNINTGEDTQPGIGNLGLEVLELTANADDPTGKNRGIVSIDGCIDLSVFDNHEFGAPGPDKDYGTADDIPHIHTCTPYDNKNKEEVIGSAWVKSFVATWEMYDEKEKLINSGTDTCILEDPQFYSDGTPVHGQEFTCTTTSDKKINWYQE